MKELLEKLKDLLNNYGYITGRFDELEGILQEYKSKSGDRKYDFYLDDIITEDDAINDIQELYSIDDIVDYINGQGSCELYKREFGRLEEFDDCDLENIIEEIIEDLEERIEQEKNQKVIDEIINFNNEIVGKFGMENGAISEGLQRNVLTEEYAEKLGNRLCEKFTFEEKENKNV